MNAFILNMEKFLLILILDDLIFDKLGLKFWDVTLPVLVATWRPAQHNHRTLSPTCDEVVNLTVFCGKKRIKRIEWKEV